MTNPMHLLPLGYKHSKNMVVYSNFTEIQDYLLFYLSNDDERLRIALAEYDSNRETYILEHCGEKFASMIYIYIYVCVCVCGV